eukprot:15463187-Alexandrium_andersonii.AAC.1
MLAFDQKVPPKEFLGGFSGHRRPARRSGARWGLTCTRPPTPCPRMSRTRQREKEGGHRCRAS